jgi:hypothetical protein
MTFADHATRLCGQAALLLGWRPAEFWDATPAELATVIAAFAPDGAAVADGALLGTLMAQYPDAPVGGE